jgi:hypothetical protein
MKHSGRDTAVPKDLPKKGDKSDLRCALVGQEVGGERVACKPVTEESWCYGCKFYVCEVHSVNCDLPFGGHDVMEHTNAHNDEGDDE